MHQANVNAVNTVFHITLSLLCFQIHMMSSGRYSHIF